MKTSRLLRVKFAWALPAVALLLFAFAEPEYKTKAMETTIPVTDVQKGEKEFVIKGKVVQDENGMPLTGASVIIKGSTIGTVTDSEGKFTLIDPNPKKGQTDGFFTDAVISYVGLETRVVTVSFVGETLKHDLQDIKLKEGVIDIGKWKISKSKMPPQPSAKDKKMPPPPPPPPPMDVYVIVEELPEYPGGFDGLIQYVTDMQVKLAREKNCKGKAKFSFKVSETGKVTNVKILEADNELVGTCGSTIVMNMKDWKPGSQRGKPVPVNYILPIEF